MRIFRREFDRFRLGSVKANAPRMLDEDAGRGFPTMPRSKRGAGFARDAERRKASRAQIVAEHANRRRTDHVARTLHREGRDRQAACEGFQQHKPEGVGLAGEYEDIAGRIYLCELFAMPRAEEYGLRIPALQFRPRRTVADDYLGAGQIEIEEGLQVLLDRDPADAQEHRRRQADVDVARMEQLGVDAARP